MLTRYQKITCDNSQCGKYLHFAGGAEAIIRKVKQEKWIVTKGTHFCQYHCYKQYKEERKEKMSQFIKEGKF